MKDKIVTIGIGINTKSLLAAAEMKEDKSVTVIDNSPPPIMYHASPPMPIEPYFDSPLGKSRKKTNKTPKKKKRKK